MVIMNTYNDFEKLKNERERMLFIRSAITQHCRSELYKDAEDAELYMRQLNPTIMNYRKLLYTVSGRAVPDNYASNHKTASNYYKRFILQQLEYLLGNGVEFVNEDTKSLIGGAKLDKTIKSLVRSGLNGAVSFGFFNYDHIEVFKITEFVPLYDEESGQLRAGIKFWKLASDKPLRVTLYEEDGVTEFAEGDANELEIVKEKEGYIKEYAVAPNNRRTVIGQQNYNRLPIIEFFGNEEHQSEIVGIRHEIDAYDLIKSGFCNDLDDVQQIYWILKNAGGMDEVDLAEFLTKLKRTKAATLDDEVEAEAHTTEVPYNARETLLNRLENDLYFDAMTFNPKELSSGNVTATAIKASYDSLDHKASELKGLLEDFFADLFALIGIEDTPIFKLKRISNDTESTQNVLSAAQYLDNRTILEKLPFIAPEEIDTIIERVMVEQSERFEGLTDGQSAEVNE